MPYPSEAQGAVDSGRGAADDQALQGLEGFARPKPVTDEEVMFGGRLETLLPPYEALPVEFRDEQDAYSAVVWQWYFRGIRTDYLRPRRGIDGKAAWRQLRAVMACWDPARPQPTHAHKTAGIAYLMSLWFEPPAELSDGVRSEARLA